MTEENKTPELGATAKQLENALKRITDLEGIVSDLKKGKPEPVKESAPTPAPAPAPKKKKREKLFDFRLWDENEDNA